MKVDPAGYVHGAQILVKPDPLSVADKNLFPEGEYTLELLVLHELCHLVLDALRTHSNNVICDLDDESIRQASSVLETETEIVAWHMARALLQVELLSRTQSLTILPATHESVSAAL